MGGGDRRREMRQRRREVDVADDAGHVVRRQLVARIDHDPRNMVGGAAAQMVAVAHAALGQVVQVLAVIRQQHDDRVVGEPVALEPRQDARDRRIGRRDRAVVERADLRASASVAGAGASGGFW